MKEELQCPKCSGNMQKGVLTGNASEWRREDERSFLQTTGKEIVTYACSGCGFLESYIKRS